MNNIFKNAYFGKAYKTRDSRKAIYWCFDGIRHKLITADNKPFQPWCENDGKDYGWNRARSNSPLDIVSEWKEEINEEELDKLAKSYDIPVYGDGCAYSDDEWDEIQDWVEDSYKAGYRKAKKN